MGINIRIQTEGLNRGIARLDLIRGRMELAPDMVAELGAQVMVDALRLVAPRRTGRLAAGISANVSGSRVTFSSSAPYTPFVIGGTAPHEIIAGFYTGKSGEKALSWGGSHPVFHVFHPGTRPNNFPREAKEIARPALIAILHEVGRWVLG